MIYREYSNKESVGWRGWIEATNGRAIAFVRLDGEIVFDW